MRPSFSFFARWWPWIALAVALGAVWISGLSVPGPALATADTSLADGVGNQIVATAAASDGPRRSPPGPAPNAATGAAFFQDALATAAELPRLHSLLVSWRGELLLERYFNGIRPTRLANIKSASKSVISALVGIAIDRGLIPSVRQPIASYFPELSKLLETVEKRGITVEDLLSMRSGLESTSNRNYGAWVQSGNWIRYALAQPLVSPPGTTMEYSTGNSHLLSAILTKVTRRSTWQFAQEALAKPLRFRLSRWPQDPQGIYFGGNDMLMAPRQMLAFGELYLNRGQANGRQVLPADWIDASFVMRARSRFSEQLYGYGWWMRELAGYETYYAWGYGGQFIFVVPDLHLTIVTTSATTVSDERRSHRVTVYDLVERYIIAPIASLGEGSS